MCICFRKRKDRKNQPEPPTVPRREASTSTSRPKAPKSPDVAVQRRTPDKQAPPKTNSSVEVLKRQLEDAQTALGRKPNTRIVDLCMEKQRRDTTIETAAVSNDTKSTMKTSDIAFPLSHSKKKSKDEDTLNPMATTPKLKPAQSPVVAKEDNGSVEEFHSDPVEEAPTSVTYMYNGREIEYCVRQLLREYDNKEEIQQVYVDVTEQCHQKTNWDPYAPKETLEARGVFKWRPLRVNTFFSNAEMAPTDEELAAAKVMLDKSNRTTARARVVIRERPNDIKQLIAETPWTVRTQDVLTLEATPRSTSHRTSGRVRVDPTVGSDEHPKDPTKAQTRRTAEGTSKNTQGKPSK